MVKVGGRNSNWKTVKQTEKNFACPTACDVSGATLPSLKATWAIRNVHDQPKSICTRPAAVNLLRTAELMTILQPQILGAWHQWRNTGHVVVTRHFLANFGRLFDRALVQILTSDFHHQTLRKKPASSAIMILEWSYPLNLSSFEVGKDVHSKGIVSVYFLCQSRPPWAKKKKNRPKSLPSPVSSSNIIFNEHCCTPFLQWVVTEWWIDSKSACHSVKRTGPAQERSHGHGRLKLVGLLQEHKCTVWHTVKPVNKYVRNFGISNGAGTYFRGGGGGILTFGGYDKTKWKILQGRSLFNPVLSVDNTLLCMYQWLCTSFQDTGVLILGGGGGYVLSGHCSRQQISVKN